MQIKSKRTSALLRCLLATAGCCIAVATVQAQGQCSLDVDGDGRADALTDGLLIMRAASGMSGGSLVWDALGERATRTSALDIQDFVDSHRATDFDIDGDGTFDAADAAIMIRYMFGLTDDAAMNRFVRPGASRKSWAAIHEHLLKTCDPAMLGTPPAQ